MVVCGKCGGTGEYKFFSTGKIEACYPCDGTGRVEASSRPAPRGRKSTPAQQAERIRLDLRAMYRNIDAMGLTYEWATDGVALTPENFEHMLTVVPEARAAFRSRGWPV